jgi:hypothetical protein
MGLMNLAVPSPIGRAHAVPAHTSGRPSRWELHIDRVILSMVLDK